MFRNTNTDISIPNKYLPHNPYLNIFSANITRPHQTTPSTTRLSKFFVMNVLTPVLFLAAFARADGIEDDEREVDFRAEDDTFEVRLDGADGSRRYLVRGSCWLIW